jgi:hypothetical protein
MLLSRVTRALPYNLDGTATAIGELSTHTHILNLKLTSDPGTVEKNWDGDLNLIQILLGQGKRTTIQLILQMMLDNACPPQALLAGTGWRTLNRSLAHHPRPHSRCQLLSQATLSTTAYLNPTTPKTSSSGHGSIVNAGECGTRVSYGGFFASLSPSPPMGEEVAAKEEQTAGAPLEAGYPPNYTSSLGELQEVGTFPEFQ